MHHRMQLNGDKVQEEGYDDTHLVPDKDLHGSGLVDLLLLSSEVFWILEGFCCTEIL